MVTFETLNNYLKKCTEFLEKLAKERDDAFAEIQAIEAQRVGLREQQLVVSGQIEVLDQLMDAHNNPHAVTELPVWSEDMIEEAHENRLEGPEGLSEEEVKGLRQPVYYHEAMKAAEDIHAANELEEDGSSEELEDGEDA